MTSPDQNFDVETDLLVIGAGAAGMTAALIGRLEGLQIILCEKSDQVGGTTATSAGTVWIPGSRQSEAAGVPDTVDAAKTYLTAMLGQHADDDSVSTYLATGPRVLDDLERRTSVRFVARPCIPIIATCRELRAPAARLAPRPSTAASSAPISRASGRRAANSRCSAA